LRMTNCECGFALDIRRPTIIEIRRWSWILTATKRAIFLPRT
jgi:hypothetical protein